MVCLEFPRILQRICCPPRGAIAIRARSPIGIASIAVLLVLASEQASHATPITYTETLTATGTIGGVAFNNAVLTFTTVADTTNITSQMIEGILTYENPGTTTVQIEGIGTATFIGGDSFGTISKILNSPPPYGLVGIGDLTLTLYFGANFIDYPPLSDLSVPYTATGAGATSFGPFQTTTLGDLAITQSVASSGTFTASTVPEPASLTPLGLACVFGGAWVFYGRQRGRRSL
jgi:hypothetical protein